MIILKRLGSESSPVELRQKVANILRAQWIVVKGDYSLMKIFWMLALYLLQDPVDTVRNEMAQSISTALSNEMMSYPGSVQSNFSIDMIIYSEMLIGE